MSAHVSADMRAWVTGQGWLETVRLPGYAPDLNPVEGVWSVLKGCVLANRAHGRLPRPSLPHRSGCCGSVAALSCCGDAYGTPAWRSRPFHLHADQNLVLKCGSRGAELPKWSARLTHPLSVGEGGLTVHRSSINPFNWHFADDQGVLVESPTQMLFVSGQTAMSDAGEPQHPGDLRAQVELTLVNVRTVLEAAGMSLSDVVQLNTHVTSIEQFQAEAADVLEREFAVAGVSPPGVLSQVVRLGHPDLLVEIDAVAVR